MTTVRSAVEAESTGSRAMPHVGQDPGFSDRTSGCIGQVDLSGGVERGTTFSDIRIFPSRQGSGFGPILIRQVRENCAFLYLLLAAILNRRTLTEDFWLSSLVALLPSRHIG